MNGCWWVIDDFYCNQAPCWLLPAESTPRPSQFVYLKLAFSPSPNCLTSCLSRHALPRFPLAPTIVKCWTVLIWLRVYKMPLSVMFYCCFSNYIYLLCFYVFAAHITSTCSPSFFAVLSAIYEYTVLIDPLYLFASGTWEMPCFSIFHQSVLLTTWGWWQTGSWDFFVCSSFNNQRRIAMFWMCSWNFITLQTVFFSSKKIITRMGSVVIFRRTWPAILTQHILW